MAETTGISWTDATVNFWVGCHRVSKACTFCYMYRDMERYKKDPTIVSRTKDGTFLSALKWKEPKKIFTCSYSDFFIEEADAWRKDAWDVIRKTPHHTWQILTKRPERIPQCLPDDWGDGWDNVWLGVSVEDTKTLWRMMELCNVPSKTRFISAEPLLESIDFGFDTEVQLRGQYLPNKKLGDMFHWLIIGGESGHGSVPLQKDIRYGYRECRLDWMEHIVNQCKENNIAVFVKQLGTHLAKTLSLKQKTGADIDEFQEYLRFQEFPK